MAQLQEQPNNAPLLLFGYGNPGRGDDALGPELISRLEVEDIFGLECQSDMQLQIEHVTDMQNRELTLFVDADTSCEAPFHFCQIHAERDESYTSHAITPHALLHTYHQVYGESATPTFLLRIRGYQFQLGAPLSRQAAANLDKASLFVRMLCSTPSLSHWNSLASS